MVQPETRRPQQRYSLLCWLLSGMQGARHHVDYPMQYLQQDWPRSWMPEPSIRTLTLTEETGSFGFKIVLTASALTNLALCITPVFLPEFTIRSWFVGERSLDRLQ